MRTREREKRWEFDVWLDVSPTVDRDSVPPCGGGVLAFSPCPFVHHSSEGTAPTYDVCVVCFVS